jgi:hypothetical protein
MKTNSVVLSKLDRENEILKKIRREIIKSAKNGDVHYYWETGGLSDSMVKGIISTLEKEGKIVKSKGINYKIIRW